MRKRFAAFTIAVSLIAPSAFAVRAGTPLPPPGGAVMESSAGPTHHSNEDPNVISRAFRSRLTREKGLGRDFDQMDVGHKMFLVMNFLVGREEHSDPSDLRHDSDSEKAQMAFLEKSLFPILTHREAALMRNVYKKFGIRYSILGLALLVSNDAQPEDRQLADEWIRLDKRATDGTSTYIDDNRAIMKALNYLASKHYATPQFENKVGHAYLSLLIHHNSDQMFGVNDNLPPSWSRFE